MEAARVIVEVVAGVIPGQPEAEYTRRWTITSAEWDKAQQQEAVDNRAGADRPGHGALLAELNGRAQGYAGWLMLQPDRINWVRTEWMWM